MPRLYEVTVVVRAYALADDADMAQAIIEENLIEIVADARVELSAQVATPETLDPDWRHLPPWDAAQGEARTCQQILDEQERTARQIGLA